MATKAAPKPVKPSPVKKPAPSDFPATPALQKALKATLALRDVSGRGVAKASGVDDASIRKAAKGERGMSEESWLKVAAASPVGSPLRVLLARHTLPALSSPEAHAVRPAEAAGAAPSNIIRVPLKRLRENPQNYRRTYDEAAMLELENSILAEGVLQNLVTFPADAKGNYVVNSGNRRLRALQRLAKKKKIDEDYLVHIFPKKMDDAEALALAIVENLQRQDVDPLEEADGFKRLRDLKWSTEQIAQAVGLKQRTVQDRLQLSVGLFKAARTALTEKKITLDQARALVTAPTAKLQENMLSLATRSYSPYSAEQLRQHLRASLPKLSDAAFDIALYKGDFVGEGKNKLFADPDKFVELQKAHAKTLLKDLKKKWAGASVVSYFFAGHYVKEPDPAKGEAFVTIEESRFHKITVHEGYRPNGAASDDDDGEDLDDEELAARDAEAAKQRALLKVELEDFASDLSTAAMNRPFMMMRLLIVTAFSEQANHLSNYWELSPAEGVLEGFSFVFGDEIYAKISTGDMLGDEDTLTLWRRLLDLREPDLCRLFGALVVPDNVKHKTHWRPSLFDHEVAESLGLKLPSGLRPALLRDDGAEKCRSCGCTQDNACVTEEGPCAWAEPGLCTACASREAGLPADEPEEDGDDTFAGDDEEAA